MQDDLDNVVEWTEENNIRINGTKTKEMIIIFQKHPHAILPLRVNVGQIRVKRLDGIK